MRFMVDARRLAQAVRGVTSLRPKGHMPALGWAGLELFGDVLQVRGTNLETWVRYSLPCSGEDDASASRVYVDAKHFARGLKGRKGDVTFETVDLVGGSSQLQFGGIGLPLQSADMYPSLPEHVGDVMMRFDRAAFVAALAGCEHAVARPDKSRARDYLQGIHFRAVPGCPGQVRLEATDGHRLHLRRLDCESNAAWDTDAGSKGSILTLPIGAAKALLRGLKGSKGEPTLIVAVGRGEPTDVQVEDGPFNFHARCLDGGFPDVESLLVDILNGVRCELDSFENERLRAAFDTVLAVVDKKCPRAASVKLVQGAPGMAALNLALDHSEQGKAEAEVSCRVAKGEDWTLAEPREWHFNPHCLAEALEALGWGGVGIGLTEPRKGPAVITDHCGNTELVMPMNL